MEKASPDKNWTVKSFLYKAPLYTSFNIFVPLDTFTLLVLIIQKANLQLYAK